MSIFEDLTTIIPLDRIEGESAETYLTRLVKSMSDVSDENWGKLSATAQNWYNTAAQAVNALQPVPACDGFPEYVPAPVQTAPAKVKREKKEKVPKEPKAAKAPKAEKVKKEPKPKVEGEAPTRIIRKLLILHPEWNLSMYRGHVLENGPMGLTPATISAVYSDTRATLNLLKELGRLPEDLIPSPSVSVVSEVSAEKPAAAVEAAVPAEA